jgi:hypothetical protein
LSSGKCLELDEHLASCADCRKFKAGLEEIHGLSLRRAPASMPSDIEKSILEKILGKAIHQKPLYRSYSGYYRIPKVAVWAAAAVILGLLFTSLFQPFRTAASIQRLSSLTAGYEIPPKVIMSEQDIVSQYTINNATIKLPKGG